ncbi:MAG: hypothetical protein OEW06_02220 [Gemmatimonadota bacterium]|nr:hypothetical protein [Gemmatimonadota bacterium]MDH4351420.1 hypothetical protein [Gemmatimonadota bacterium]
MTRALCLALALTTAPGPLLAQDGRIPRKWLMAGVGALVTGAMATVYALAFEQDIGGCSKATCVIPVSVVLGGGIGYMIGKEMDDLYAVRYSHAPPLKLRGRELSLTMVPNDVVVHDSTVLVTGTEGVEVVRAGPTLDRLGLRARGLRGIGDVAADNGRNLLLVGSAVGLYRFPLLGDDPGTLAYPGEISALSADGSRLLLGLGLEVQLARIGDSVEAVGTPMAEDARVVDVAWQGNQMAWVLTEERLAAYGLVGDSLVFRGAMPFPVLARRVSIADSVALVSAGSGGLYALDIRNPAAPAEITNWSGARFVYDAAMRNGIAYVAGGPEGLYVLRLTAAGFEAVGLSRGVGFVAAVEAGPDAIYLLDRTGLALRRLDPQPE